MELLRACDVGLALFRPVYTHWMNGRNIRQIGLSSGKFSNYLACGLPVICDADQDQFQSLAARYPVVHAIRHADEVAPALRQALASAADHERWCETLFRDALDPRHGILKYIEALRANTVN
jgi:hypothetical protein